MRRRRSTVDGFRCTPTADSRRAGAPPLRRRRRSRRKTYRSICSWGRVVVVHVHVHGATRQGWSEREGSCGKNAKSRRSRPAGEDPARVRNSHPPGSQPCAGIGNEKAMRRQTRRRAVCVSPEIGQKPEAEGVVDCPKATVSPPRKARRGELGRGDWSRRVVKGRPSNLGDPRSPRTAPVHGYRTRKLGVGGSDGRPSARRKSPPSEVGDREGTTRA